MKMNESNVQIRRVGNGYQAYDVRTGVGVSRMIWATPNLAEREKSRLIKAGFIAKG